MLLITASRERLAQNVKLCHNLSFFDTAVPLNRHLELTQLRKHREMKQERSNDPIKKSPSTGRHTNLSVRVNIRLLWARYYTQ